MNKQLNILFLFLLACTFSIPIASGQTTVDFEDLVTGSMFENDVAGDTAGPITIAGSNGFAGSTDVTFTTDSVTGFVDTSSFGLGVNSGGGDPDTESFNIGETWGVRTDADLFFEGLDIGGLQDQETFTMSSDAWINLQNINPGTGVQFEGSTGTFFFIDDNVPLDQYSVDYITGGETLRITAGVAVVFGDLTSTFGPNDDVELQSLTLSAVPEPASGLVLLVLAIGTAGRRRRTC